MSKETKKRSSKNGNENEEVNETETKTRKRSEVTWSMRFYTFKLKERKVISRKGNEVMFVEFTQGRKVGDRIFGGRIAIPMFRLGQFLCELVEAIDTIVRRYNLSEDDLRRLKVRFEEVLETVESGLSK